MGPNTNDVTDKKGKQNEKKKKKKTQQECEGMSAKLHDYLVLC